MRREVVAASEVLRRRMRRGDLISGGGGPGDGIVLCVALDLVGFRWLTRGWLALLGLVRGMNEQINWFHVAVTCRDCPRG